MNIVCQEIKKVQLKKCFMAAVKMQMSGMVKTESNNMYIFLKNS